MSGSPLRDPAAAREARAIGLHYRFDDTPGLRRRRRGERFVYLAPDGRTLRDAQQLARIRKLAVPPAWQEVWISPDPDAHILATGRDQRGRKQYRYHPAWRAVRDGDKYQRMIAFAEALPRIRRRVARDLRRPGLPREKVLATIVRLLEVSLIRVGNDEYARANRSYGLTTMRDRHVDVSGNTVAFDFRGKSGKRHHIEVVDRRLARIVRNCRDLPGYELFQYVDADGRRRPIESGDVNAYLRQVAGQDFTAKDFRTWAGTVLAALALRELQLFDSQAAARRQMTRAIETVAARLGNTPSICRKCYIHPAVFDAYLDRSLADTLAQRADETLRSRSVHRLGRTEAAVLGLLRARLARQVRPTRREELGDALRRSLAAL